MKKIKINKIKKEGGVKKEYVLLQATEDVNIGNYAIMDNTFDEDGRLSNIHPHFFHFPSKNVKKGDYIVLFTGNGKPYTGELEGKPLHYYYWGSNAPIWNDDETDWGVLLYVATIDKKKAG